MSKERKKKIAVKRKTRTNRLVKPKNKPSHNIHGPKETHPWRICPPGEHWVRIHPRDTPQGETTTVTGHCRTNPSRKDQIYALELTKIAEKYFDDVSSLPAADELGYRRGNEYDRLIAGWTKYWNDVLKPEQPLRPNLVKALIATESSFDPKAIALASKKNWARGLTQVTDQTLKILSDEEGEIKDHLVNIDQKEAYDPNLNVAAGIRWLFHKKHLLEHRKQSTVTWEDAVMEYKSYTKDIAAQKPRALKKQKEFLEKYERLDSKR